MKRALITGITGQDGSYLAENLIVRGYEVHGFARQDSWFRPHCSSHLTENIKIHFGDMSEGVDISAVLQEVMPDEIYNLASQSRPGDSWLKPVETLVINGMGATRLFEAVRHTSPNSKIYHASSSDMFGMSSGIPLNEETPFNPTNPYSASKVYAHHVAKIYRESYGLFISCGILFNHESERRQMCFLTQKVAHGAACAALGIKNSPYVNERGRPIVENGFLTLGNLNVSRDWGYAGDFVEAMRLMLQEDLPDDYVIGTGQLHTLTELCETAYDIVGKNYHEHIRTDPALVRPNESGGALADPSKAKEKLGWRVSVSFEQMVRLMVEAQKKSIGQQGLNNLRNKKDGKEGINYRNHGSRWLVPCRASARKGI